jgi:hypothetical protein
MKIATTCIALVLFLASCADHKDEQVTVTPVNGNDTNKRGVPETVLNLYAPVDVSPMDMSYFPVDYPKLKMAKTTTQPPFARVVYSRPHLGGRKLFTDIQKYNEPWRLGANESTELDLYKPATVLNKKIPAGRYVLYCIPQPDKWTIIFNTNKDTWGLHPDTTKDVASFEIPVSQKEYRLEYFTIVFEGKDAAAELVMAWDNTEARLPFSF